MTHLSQSGDFPVVSALEQKHGEYRIRAMEALFAFSDAMEQGELSIIDLRAIILDAVDDGHDVMRIGLLMACNALELAKGER